MTGQALTEPARVCGIIGWKKKEKSLMAECVNVLLTKQDEVVTPGPLCFNRSTTCFAFVKGKRKKILQSINSPNSLIVYLQKKSFFQNQMFEKESFA